MSKLMEYNFNTWTTPVPTDPPTIPGASYYPDLSGNAYNLDDNRGNSFQAGDGPAGDAGGQCLHLYTLNTYFGINTSVADSAFNWGTTGNLSIFFCMKIMDIPPITGFFPIIHNFALNSPYWNIYLDFSSAHDNTKARPALIYEEVGSFDVVLKASSNRMSVDYTWHTYAVTVNRSTGTAIYYLDAEEQNQRTWDTALNTNIEAEQHEITLFGTNSEPNSGHLISVPPVALRFDGLEFYDNILSLGDIQALHASYT